MLNGLEFTVFFSSRSFGGHKGREGLWPVCHSCDKALGLKNNDEISKSIPPEAMPLVFSAEQAAIELGIKLVLVDINQMPFFQKLKFKLLGKPIPCLKIGEKIICGIPTKEEILEFYYSQQGL